MKKAGVGFLWAFVILLIVPFLALSHIASQDLNYPQTAFWPLVGVGLLMEGAGALARGIGKDKQGWKIAGGVELVIGLLLVLIARPLNQHTGVEFGSVPWPSDVAFVLSMVILFPQPIVHVLAFLQDHENDPTYGMGSAYRREYENVLKTRYVKDDYRGVRETVSTGSAIGRSLVGGAIGGDLGAVVGAMTAKTKTVGQPKAVFIVWYKDGTDAVKTVKMNSPYYDLYLSRLER